MAFPIKLLLICAIKHLWLYRICLKYLVLLSGIAEFDETFVLDCYKGGSVPPEAGRIAHKHVAKASKCGISNEYIAICIGIQRDGGVVALTVNRAKLSSRELCQIFDGHIADNTLALTDGLRSYNALFSIAFRCANNRIDRLFSSICTTGRNCY